MINSIYYNIPFSSTQCIFQYNQTSNRATIQRSILWFFLTTCYRFAIELVLQLNIRHGGVVSLVSKLVVFAPFPNYFELRQFAPNHTTELLSSSVGLLVLESRRRHCIELLGFFVGTNFFLKISQKNLEKKSKIQVQLRKNFA